MKTLKNPNGDWVTDPSPLEHMVQTYFQCLFEEAESYDTEMAPLANVLGMSKESVNFLSTEQILYSVRKSRKPYSTWHLSSLLGQMGFMRVFTKTCGKSLGIQCVIV